MTELQISSDLSLPLDAITETFAILAVKGAGKSNAAVVMAEELYDAGLPWVAVDPKGDWYGVRSSGDGSAPGLSVVVFGGEHADVPLEPTAGRYLADLIAEQRLTCVLDVSEMTKADQRRFLTDFAERLYKRNREPLMVFCEEADEYIPQMVRGEATKLVGAFETLVKRGRFRGIGITLVTQRSASLNKDVLTQVETLIAMRTPSPQDRKAILGWVDTHDVGRDLVNELPSLESGEAWVFSPHTLRTVQKIRFRRRRTFDSGATPKVGGKPRPPARLADVDLAAIKEAMADTIERAKADDPKELRRQIAALQQECQRLGRDRDAIRDELEQERTAERVHVEHVRVFSQDDERTLGDLDESVERLTAELSTLRSSILSGLPEGAKEGSAAANARTPATSGSVAQPGTQRTPSARRAGSPTERPPARESASRPVATGDIGKGERVILTAIAQYLDGVTREQLTVLTGYKRSSRDTYVQRLRTAGLVDAQSGLLVATEAAFDVLGDDFTPLPTGRALRDHWLTTLTGGEREILAVLIDAYPAGVHRDEISERTGYKRSSRDTYLQRLRARQLVTTNGDPCAADVLFLDA